MKILCISDTHTLQKRIPASWISNENNEIDCIIHAGDIGSRGSLQELNPFLEWFNTLNFKSKIFIAGNHDWMFQNQNEECIKILNDYPDITYLQDSYIIVNGIKIYGSPWQPEFYSWAFNLQRGEEILNKWNMIPSDTDVLITHGPPYGIGDFVPYRGGEFVGCKDLLGTIITKLNIKYHIFGHIHYSYGQVFKGDVTFINASTADESYQIVNPPIIFTI